MLMVPLSVRFQEALDGNIETNRLTRGRNQTLLWPLDRSFRSGADNPSQSTGPRLYQTVHCHSTKTCSTQFLAARPPRVLLCWLRTETHRINSCIILVSIYLTAYFNVYINTSISIASMSFTGRVKFIPQWTSLALSPRKGTGNTNDVGNSPLFLDCCYFKIASTRCKDILIATSNKFRIFQYRRRLLLFTSFYSVYVQFNQNRFT